ncbi:MAG: HTH domain-containing protein [Bacteroidales bacterium]|nr:HTH domain-containing protein [Bacteroidales bacterium]
MNPEDLFGDITRKFIQRLNKATDTEAMFAEMEKIFFDNLLVRDLSLSTETVNLIENSEENIEVTKLAKELGVTDRTIRNHFYDHVGCLPKKHIKFVKFKKITYQLAHLKDSSLVSIKKM